MDKGDGGRQAARKVAVGRPNAGWGAFLAGAYKCMLSEQGFFPRAVAKGVATVLLFSLVPQQADVRSRGGGGAEGPVLFVDAAEEGTRFRVGVVGSPGMYRSKLCPRWVRTLQQAELMGIWEEAKIAAYRGWWAIVVGNCF